MRYSIRRICLRLLLGSMALMALSPAALAFDQWGDNGSTPAGGGSGGGGGGGGPGPDPGPKGGEPVAFFTGQYTLDAVDVNIPGRMPLRVHRMYRSGSAYQGMFGRGWNIDYNERVFILSTNGNLLVRRASTVLDTFTNLGNNVYAPPMGVFDALQRNGDGTYTLRDKFGTVHQYNVNGCLTEVRDRNGNQLILSYDPGGKEPINAVSDFSHFTNAILLARDYRLTRIEVAFTNALTGRYLQFYYDNNGRVTNATDFTGRSWIYQYDAGGLGTLTSVTTPPASGFPSGLTTTYGYSPTNGHWLQAVTDQSGNALLTNSCDAQGRIIQQFWGAATWSYGYPTATNRWLTNGNGYVSQRIFTTNGLMLQRIDYTAGLRSNDPPFYSTLYSYTNLNQQTKVTFPAGNVDASLYDNMGNLLELRHKAADAPNSPQDLVTDYTYEPLYNQVQTVTGGRGETTTNIYDYQVPSSGATNGNLIGVVYPAVGGVNPTVSYTYSPQGETNSVTNQTGTVTLFVHDPATGYLLQEIDAYGTALAATNSFTYDARGNVLTATDPLGNTTTNTYDNLDRLIQVTAPAPFNYLTKYSYTGNGRWAQILKQTGDATHPWQTNTLTYDLLDRLLTFADDSGHVTQINYDGDGNQTQVIDANSNTTTMVYDERDLLWKASDALSNTIVQSYTANQLPASRLDPRGNATVFGYDSYGRLAGITNADSTYEQFLYDLDSNLIAKRKRSGHWITNSYDALNRLHARNYADGSTRQFTIDAASRVLEVVDTNGTSGFAYDALGRTTSTTNVYGQILQYTYDRAGNVTRLTYPDSTFVDYAYDNLARVTNIDYAGTQQVGALSYDALSRRTRVNFGNGTSASYAYDYANRMLDLLHSPAGGGGPLAHFTYTYDQVGSRLTQNVSGTSFPGLNVFGYDGNLQVTNAQYAAGSPFAATRFAYDGAINRAQVIAGGTTNYTANSRNQYSSVGGQVLSYNPNGGLTTNGSWSYAYDDEDRLIAAQGPGVNASFVYDFSARRVSKNVNGAVRQFLYNDLTFPAELAGESGPLGTNVPVKYIYFGLSPFAMVVSNTLYALHCDHLERPVLATDPSGAVAWEGTYSAFGESSIVGSSQVTQPLRVSGQYQDGETGLYYNFARYYEPRLGRYITEDPAFEAGSPLYGEVQGNNAYAYVQNNPVNLIDPNGQSALIACSAGIPVCSAALFCSLNVGACSAGVFCSANVGACSVAAVCSGSVGACSAGGACSANASGCSASAGFCSVSGGACSASQVCSVSVGACSVGGVCSAAVGACSVASDSCSSSVGKCSAGGCKHAGVDNGDAESLLVQQSGPPRGQVVGLSLNQHRTGDWELRLATLDCKNYAVFVREEDDRGWRICATEPANQAQVMSLSIKGGQKDQELRVSLTDVSGNEQVLGPFHLSQTKPGPALARDSERGGWSAVSFLACLLGVPFVTIVIGFSKPDRRK